MIKTKVFHDHSHQNEAPLDALEQMERFINQEDVEYLGHSHANRTSRQHLIGWTESHYDREIILVYNQK
ncbi:MULTISPECIES: hypothetical protein [Erysipelothrix]|uniref:Uncharacterized protein n=1 Tax=Erysipelothrix piscisicarius TaxID=2485784 RepID=A0A3Q8S7F1_9FIRM|nr:MULTISPECIES: hypothetical protein [Erysipelothrix]AZK44036.1 hypothetical protein EEI45_04005 [Erysipelothrix piscisicarius]MBK2402869.1 hypothetical protein [Erysipelothrix sp. strain 2 (EsS2-6-Brazil)]MBK2404334.1 hypothetical protein [Erysipelothrix sp. strain 2 (EsS2-7-Brazil)]NBA01644.1 hypothetical protein [Erysipelothrix rhusiopathiae]